LAQGADIGAGHADIAQLVVVELQQFAQCPSACRTTDAGDRLNAL